VNDTPSYKFGKMVNDKFVCITEGEGEEVLVEKLGVGVYSLKYTSITLNL